MPGAQAHPWEAAQLLQLWENAWDLPPLHRAVAMAAAASGVPPAEVGAWPVGRRDAVLWQLRGHLFGRRLDGVTRCPACQIDVEVCFDQDTLLAGVQETAAEVSVNRNGQDHRFRTPTSADLAAVLSSVDAPAAVLVERCQLDGGSDAFTGDLTPVLDAWERADPLADITLAMTCPGCSRQWDEQLDVTTFLWSELDTWCRRTMVEVHELAVAYGWAEADVLSLTPWRRQCYLGMVAS